MVIGNRSKQEKRTYLRNLEFKLAEKNATLSYVKRRVDLARQAGRIHASEQLLKAEHQAECAIADLRKQLDRLKAADDDSWEASRFNVEVAWDEMTQSIKKIVARFP